MKFRLGLFGKKKKYNDDLHEKIRQWKEERQAKTDGGAGSGLDEVMAEVLLDDGGANLNAEMDEVAANDSPIKLNTRKRKSPGFHVSMKPPLIGIILFSNKLYCNIPTKTLLLVISSLILQKQSRHLCIILC